MALSAGPRASTLNKTSPFFKTTPTRSKSPTRNEQSLSLKRVIGTTTASNASFSSLTTGSVFALAAGSGAILYELNDQYRLSQRFFYSKPAGTATVTNPSFYDSPTTFNSQHAARQRAAAALRESGYGVPNVGFPLGETNDSPNKSVTNKTKAVTCLALSPDGKLLALGETGHKPRVLIFSTSKYTGSDTAQTSLFEHTFGVRCLAFSPDSQYLASLGDVNDGFLHVWQINRNGTVALYASNKCTSNIRQIVWMGNSLITCGTRHVKIWRVEENVRSPVTNKRFSEASFASPNLAPRTLLGRPCLRGPLLDRIFTAATAISNTQAIVCSDIGEICLLNDVEPSPSFVKIADAAFQITATASRSRETILISGSGGELKRLELKKKDIAFADEIDATLIDAKIGSTHTSKNSLIAMGFMGKSLLTVDCTKGLMVFAPSESASESAENVNYNLKHSMPGHSGTVLGICQVAEAAELGVFATWSADGLVKFWDLEGSCTGSLTVALEQLGRDNEDYVNELRVVSIFEKGQTLISGDRFGVLRILNIRDNRMLFETKAHSAEITSIAIHTAGSYTMIATAGRDRAIQIFRWQGSACEHLQTIEEHAGAINNLSFTSDGRRLVSTSSDRTIMIMDAVPLDDLSVVAGFIVNRPITLKSTPCSLHLSGMSDNSTIIVSTVDRHVNRYELTTGNLRTSFKSTDQEGGEAVTLNSCIEIPVTSRASVIAGVSSGDKSIRIYDEAGRLLDREYGHTEGMTGIMVVEASEKSLSPQIITVASDGTMFLWDLLAPGQQVQKQLTLLSRATTDPSLEPNPLATRPPLRRVLSSSELTRLHNVREEGNTSTPALSPTIEERPTLRRKASKLSMVQTPKLEPPGGVRSATQSPSAAALESMQKRRTSTVRPTSPSNSTRRGTQTVRGMSQTTFSGSNHNRRRSKSAAPSPGGSSNSLVSATEAICKSLHAFRKKLGSSSEILALDNVRELEKELSLTAKVLAERSSRNDIVMTKLLDQYSEKLVDMLDEKIEASIARQMRARTRDDDDSNNDYAVDDTDER